MSYILLNWKCDWIKHAKPALFNAKAIKDCYSANSEIMLGFFMTAYTRAPLYTLQTGFKLLLVGLGKAKDSFIQ
jgi:hypothetical protein